MRGAASRKLMPTACADGHGTRHWQTSCQWHPASFPIEWVVGFMVESSFKGRPAPLRRGGAFFCATGRNWPQLLQLTLVSGSLERPCRSCQLSVVSDQLFRSSSGGPSAVEQVNTAAALLFEAPLELLSVPPFPESHGKGFCGKLVRDMNHVRAARGRGLRVFLRWV